MARSVVRVSQKREPWVLLIGSMAGLAVGLAGPRPTGDTPIDLVLILITTTLVIWAAATAPWWMLIIASGGATAIAPSTSIMVAGLTVFLFSVWVSLLKEARVVERSLVVAGTVVVLALEGNARFFGLTAIIGITTAVLLAGFGLWRRPSTDRKIGIRLTLAAASLSVLAVGAFTLSGLSAKTDLQEGNQAARIGLDMLKQGEFDDAQHQFAQASRSFESANHALDKPWAQFARLVPIVSQHREAADQLAGGAASATRRIDIELRDIDLDTLRLVDGRVDLDAIRALVEPMQNLQIALTNLDNSVAQAHSPWLVDRLQVKIDDLSVEIAEQQELGDKAINALELAPQMLGSEGERVYFVMFTTPAEARGQGGFMGNYAELSIDNGKIEMTAFGRHTDLTRSAAQDIVLTGPEDWLARYGPFGFQSGPNKTFDPRAWANITMSPHFPSTAQVIAQLYPKSGGRAVDGVINLDVFALQELVGLVGPIEIAESPEPLTGENTANFLLLDQYFVEDQNQRTDMLDTVARATIENLLNTNPPNPIETGRSLVPLVRQGRASIWVSEVAEQQMLASINASAARLGPPANANQLVVTVNNASASKIDTFIDVDFTTLATRNADGVPQEASVFITNNLHLEERDFPPYVIGNAVGLDEGTAREYVTVFSRRTPIEILMDGEKIDVHVGRENGWFSNSFYVNIASGEQRQISILFEALGPESQDPISVIFQPTANFK